MSIATFERDGFALVPDVFSADEVARMRSTVAGLFALPSKQQGDISGAGRIGSIRFDVCARYPELRWILGHEGLLRALRELLGEDFLYLPEMSMHQSGFGDWHKDTTSQERAGQTFHWDPGFLMVEAAIYLQPNTETYGGGLEVIPGSHKTPDTYKDVGHTGVASKVQSKLKQLGVLKPKPGYRIPSKAGDLVLFHFRLDHKATWPKVKEMPAEKQKLALFFACSKNNAYARQYRDYIGSRADYVYLQKHDYPEDLLAYAREKSMTLLP